MAEQNDNVFDSDSIIAALKAEKEKALQVLAAKFDRIIADLQALSAGSRLEIEYGDIARQAERNEGLSIGPGEFHNLSYTKAAKQILEKAKKPLVTQEILSYFEKSGRKMPGKNPVATLYSSLNKSGDFELVTRNTWGLGDWYGKKRKPPQGIAERTNEIMRHNTISFVEARKQAQKEIEKETKQA